MRKKEWSNRAVYDLLNLIERGYEPTDEEREMLDSRENLNLANKKLQTMPRSIKQLRSLRKLDLSGNPITDLPDELAVLEHLEVLELSETQLIVLPKSILLLWNLRVLNLRYVPIPFLTIGGFWDNTLEELDLSRSSVKELPEGIGFLEKLKTLNCSKTEISALPFTICDLWSLETLDLGNTRITELPFFLGKLDRLEKLYLDGTMIGELPRSFWELPSLKSLSLSNTPLAELPEEISGLRSLERLNLYGMRLSALPEGFWELGSLQYLNLGNLPLPVLPEGIGKLRNLQRLHINYSALQALPETLGDLAELRDLELDFAPITTLPQSFGKLKKLETLSLYSTKLPAVPDPIRELESLQRLDLRCTPMTELPEWIGELPSLQVLYLEGMTLDHIPKSLALKGLPFYFRERTTKESVNNAPGIWCKGLQLRNQDVSIFEAGPEAIQMLYAGGEKTVVRETRLIFLGDGGVGKTYTIRRILNGGEPEPADPAKKDPRYQTHETPGVEIEDLRVDRGEDSFDIHFWDFGGQAILHSMHRCFLTGDTVYLIMVDTRHRNANRRANFWLRNIRGFAKDAPVMLMLNCWDQDDRDQVLEDEYYLRQKYPNLKQVVRLNAKYDDLPTFRGFMDKLFDFAAGSASCAVEIDAGWERVRRRVREEGRSRYCLTKAEYLRICEDCGIDEAQRPALRNWLNILGVSFSYYRREEDEALTDYQLLDPGWLTNALYAIIREGSRQAQEGVIAVSAVEDMLRESPPEVLNGEQYTRTRPDLRYDETACGYILKIAEQFNLAYRIDAERLFFPALCKEQRPKEVEPKRALRTVCCEIDYDYLPDSVVHQLMVACKKKELVMKHCWFHGFVLRGFGGLSAVVEMNEDDKKLSVKLFSEKKETKVWPLLEAIHETLKEVNDRLSLECTEYIIAGNNRFAWQQLWVAWTYNCPMIPGCDGMYPVSELLGDIYPPEKLEHDRNLQSIP